MEGGSLAPHPARVKRGASPCAAVAMAVGGGDRGSVFVMAAEEESSAGHRGCVSSSKVVPRI